MKKLFIILAVVSGFLTLYSYSAAEAGDYLVIVHSANDVQGLTADEISDFLLKKRTRWSDGTPVAPVDLGSGSPIRDVFSKDVHGRSVKHIENYWNRKIFTGEDVPPPKLASDRDVIDFVRRNRGAIGYVSPSAPLDGVKKVEVRYE